MPFADSGTIADRQPEGGGAAPAPPPAGFCIGDVRIEGRVLTAPMTGFSDLPFRRAASRLGSPYVATEMVACEMLAKGRPDVVRRAAVGEGLPLMVVQLVGREAHWLAEGAALAEGKRPASYAA